MSQYRIGEAAQLTGVSAHSIRFYEARGLLLGTVRSGNGYRAYDDRDLRRLRLIRNLRALGVPLEETAALVQEAFGSECGHYLRQLGAVLDRQQETVHQRLVELQSLAADLEALKAEAEQAASRAAGGSLVDECPCCPLIDDHRDERAYCGPAPPAQTRALPMSPADELLEVLSCDVTARPAGAPGVEELRPMCRAMREQPGEVTFVFDVAASPRVTRFVEAERRCCGLLEFTLAESPDEVTLTVLGTPAQAAAFASLWQASR
jgi:DNA-binding transcriptional MerR regulator